MPAFQSMEFPIPVMSKKVVMGSGSTTVAANLTRYLGIQDQCGEISGINFTAIGEVGAAWVVTRAGLIKNFVVKSTVVPGAGQSFVYTIMRNGVATAITATIGAAADKASDLVNSIYVVVGDVIQVQVVTSAGAAVTSHATAFEYLVNMPELKYEKINFTTADQTVAAAATAYLASSSQGGQDRGNDFASELTDQGSYLVARKGTLRNLVVLASVPPGVGQTFTYMVRLNRANTALTVVISGAVQVLALDTTNVLLVVAGDVITFRVVVSAGGAVTAHCASLDFEEGEKRVGGL